MSALAVPLILFSSLAQTPAPRDLVARAVTAMGGESAVRGIQNYTIAFYSTTFGLGQEETPESPARATITTGTQTTDFAGTRQISVTEARNPAGQINKQRRITVGHRFDDEREPGLDGRQSPTSSASGVARSSGC